MESNKVRKPKVRLGSLTVNKRTFTNNGQSVEKNMISLALGSSKNKDPKWNTTVEITVKDHTGKVIHQQVNGFLNLVDPRTYPDELFASGLIDENTHAEMKEKALASTPPYVKYRIEASTKN